MSYQGGNQGGRGYESQNWGDRGDSEVTSFKVEGKDAGRIIGKGGQRKRELEANSGATIRVGNQDHDGQTLVEIMGDPSCRQAAETEIKRILDRASQGQYGGGGGGGGGFSRGGGGGGGGACYKCGEEGHFARDCPSGGQDGGYQQRSRGGGGGGGAPRGNGCYECGQDGHFARECPTRNGGGGGGGRFGGK